MTETEFRFKHSQLIEYYQYVEMRLRFICAALLADEERTWFERLDDYGADPMGKLIWKLDEIQKSTGSEFLSEEDTAELNELRANRNYWCHQAFSGELHVTFKRDAVKREMVLKRPEYAKKIEDDLDAAIKWDEKLTNVSHAIDAQKDIIRKQLLQILRQT
jgi:hypothetical protein